MFGDFYSKAPTDADLAAQCLIDEGTYRFPSFDANDAVTLVGLSIALVCPTTMVA